MSHVESLWKLLLFKFVGGISVIYTLSFLLQISCHFDEIKTHVYYLKLWNCLHDNEKPTNNTALNDFVIGKKQYVTGTFLASNKIWLCKIRRRQRGRYQLHLRINYQLSDRWLPEAVCPVGEVTLPHTGFRTSSLSIFSAGECPGLTSAAGGLTRPPI